MNKHNICIGMAAIHLGTKAPASPREKKILYTIPRATVSHCIILHHIASYCITLSITSMSIALEHHNVDTTSNTSNGLNECILTWVCTVLRCQYAMQHLQTHSVWMWQGQQHFHQEHFPRCILGEARWIWHRHQTTYLKVWMKWHPQQMWLRPTSNRWKPWIESFHDTMARAAAECGPLTVEFSLFLLPCSCNVETW